MKKIVLFLISFLFITNVKASGFYIYDDNLYKGENKIYYSDILKDKDNNIIILGYEIVDKVKSHNSYLYTYQNVLIKYQDDKTIFKVKGNKKTLKTNSILKDLKLEDQRLYIDEYNDYYVIMNDGNVSQINKYNDEGRIIYSKGYSGQVNDFLMLNDNTIILVGEKPGFIKRIARQTGEIIWDNIEENSAFFSLIIKDHNLFIVGKSGEEPILVKYNIEGYKEYSSSLEGNFFTKIKLLKDGYIILGKSLNGGILTKYNFQEKIIWQLDKLKSDMEYLDLYEKDGKYLVVGILKEGYNKYFKLILVDTNGNLIKEKKYDIIDKPVFYNLDSETFLFVSEERLIILDGNLEEVDKKRDERYEGINKIVNLKEDLYFLKADQLILLHKGDRESVLSKLLLIIIIAFLVILLLISNNSKAKKEESSSHKVIHKRRLKNKNN